MFSNILVASGARNPEPVLLASVRKSCLLSSQPPVMWEAGIACPYHVAHLLSSASYRLESFMTLQVPHVS